jgi:hypothetical protein
MVIRQLLLDTGVITHEKEIVVLWFCAQILEDRLLPVAFHVVPVINHAVSNGVMDSIAGCLGVGESLVADEEVKVLHASL